MFEPLGTPAFLADARGGGAKRSAFREILIFFLVILIGETLGNVLLTPYILIAMLTDARYWELAATGDTDAIFGYVAEFEERLAQSPSYMLFVLFATAATIGTVLVYCRLIEKRSFFSMGLTKKWLAPYAGGLLSGLLMFAASLGFSAAFGAVRYEGISASLNLPLVLVFFLAYAVQGFSEELLCRGYLMVSLGKGMPLFLAVFTNALAFAALHLANANFTVLGFINIFLFGILTSLYMIRGGNIWGAAALHTVWNFAEGILVDFPVSGMPMPVSVFSFSPSDAHTFIHGGAFGPEGGIAVTCVLTVAIAVLAMMKSKAQESPTL